jgi:hypothetical protein
MKYGPESRRDLLTFEANDPGLSKNERRIESVDGDLAILMVG